ncbi:MAG: ABC transporter permease [Thermoplasmatota archaeon]
MPEGIGAYPRWQGTLRPTAAWLTIANEEVRRAWNNTWARTAITLAGAYAIVYIASLYTASRAGGDPNTIHTMDNFLNFLDTERWAALGVAAIMASGALLDDQRRGALELYLSRAVTPFDYLLGKIVAVVGLTTVTMAVPALIYWGASYAIFTTSPANWQWVPFTATAYSLIWGILVSGLGLGLAAMSRSSRASAIILFAGMAVLDIVVSSLLVGITKASSARLISPFADDAQLHQLLFQVAAPNAFPDWWGTAAVIGLAIVGWALVVWRHPRLFRGVS